MGYSVRERALICLLALTLLLALIWYGIVQPLSRAQAAADARLSAAIDTRLAVLAAQSAGTPADHIGLGPSELLALAEADGMAATITGGGEGATEMRIDAVRPDIAFGWAARLEQEQGVKITNAAVTRNERGTVSLAVTVAR
ncbi:type II secretion system protein M [Pacificimonas sp. WHA3]|uniref:Type II secretion system protein M n=2 Tax=Pacificimonas pallii TaxID=2827236 RepID=A0ABS6SHC2_9SPHN|nr:type II secretion system protein M [Pacificimonas pallii]